MSRLHKAFAKNSSANIKLLKTQLNKIGQSGGYLGRPLRPLLKTGLPLIENVSKYQVKAAALASDGAIHKLFMLGSGMTALLISNKEMNYIMKIVKPLEKSGLL